MKYSLLWATKDANRICNNNIFWVFMEINIRMGINPKPQLSPTLYNSLQSYAEFKVDLHNIYIRVCKDPTKKWSKLPFLATDDVIFNVLETWPPEWRAPDIAAVEMSMAQKKKEEVKPCTVQFAEKRRQEVAAEKAQEARDSTLIAVE